MKKILNTAILASLALLPVSIVFADPTNATLTTLINDLIGITNRLVVLLMGVAVLVFIWSLMRYLATSDDAASRAEWRGYMIYAVIAFAVISGLWGLVNATLDLFGLQGGGIPQFQTVPNNGNGGVINCPAGTHNNPVLGPGVPPCVNDN